MLLVVTLLDSGIRTADMRRVALALAFGALLGALAAGPGRLPRPALAAGLAAVLVVAGVGGYAVQKRYLRDRYAGDELAFARDLGHTRIAVVGGVRAYPLYGTRLTNRVDQIARLGPHGSFGRVRGCRAWRSALAGGGYRYVVTSPPLLPYTAEGLIFGPEYDPKRAPEEAWTRSDPAATEIARSGKLTVFRLDGRADPGGCARG